MKNSTNHESFILKQSTVEGGGIGVIQVHLVQVLFLFTLIKYMRSKFPREEMSIRSQHH